jgi:gluconate 2-dehydrogenase gamma chain
VLKVASRSGWIDSTIEKRGSSNKAYSGPLESGLNRRAFLKTSTAISLLAGLTLYKPILAGEGNNSNDSTDVTLATGEDSFTKEQQIVLDAVQMQLFPDDGDGPSARDLNGIAYLEWAMTDQININDGDPDFIVKGIDWLSDLSQQTHGANFVELNDSQQDKVLRQVVKSQTGENWLSILLYYLTEALMLDPIYGGNPEMIGWTWLQHQAGFPRPITGKTYRDFE